MLAQLSSIVINSFRAMAGSKDSKSLDVGDFIPKWGETYTKKEREQTVEEQKAIMMAILKPSIDKPKTKRRVVK